MGSSQKVSRMMRQIASQDEVRITSRTGIGKLPRLVLVAEQFGFMYADAREKGENKVTEVLLVRDPSPAAQQRAAETMARHPQAGNGGDLPGMQPGDKLKPLPDAKAHLELIKARINVDLTDRRAEKRIFVGAGLFTAAMLFGQVTDGIIDPVFASPITWGVVMVVLALGFVYTRRRNARFVARLQEAGFTAVRDEQGNTRYLPPGGQLPGHANPFGGHGQVAQAATQMWS